MPRSMTIDDRRTVLMSAKAAMSAKRGRLERISTNKDMFLFVKDEMKSRLGIDRKEPAPEAVKQFAMQVANQLIPTVAQVSTQPVESVAA